MSRSSEVDNNWWKQSKVGWLVSRKKTKLNRHPGHNKCINTCISSLDIYIRSNYVYVWMTRVMNPKQQKAAETRKEWVSETWLRGTHKRPRRQEKTRVRDGWSGWAEDEQRLWPERLENANNGWTVTVKVEWDSGVGDHAAASPHTDAVSLTDWNAPKWPLLL